MVCLKLTADFLYAKDPDEYLQVVKKLDSVMLFGMYAIIIVLYFVLYVFLVLQFRHELKRGLSENLIQRIKGDIRNLRILVVSFCLASIMNTPTIFVFK